MITSESNKRPLPDFASLKHVHIVGVCGTLMGAFAAFLKRRGIEVTGSDQNVYPPMSDVLGKAGVKLFSGYSASNLTALGKPADLVVIGNVIQSSNPEARAAIDGGLAYSSLPEAMEMLLLPKTRNLVVAGTHGKTTTSSLLAYTLSACQKDPSYFIGGVLQDLPHSFHVSNTNPGSYFVLEGDEYDTAFWDKVPKFNHYLPDDVILTSVEFDHADIYADLEAVMRAFRGLMERIRPGGRLIACADYANVMEVSRIAQVPVITYGMTSKARFTPGKIALSSEGARFEVRDGGKVVDEVAVQMAGEHNVLNALSVWIECRELGIPADQLRQAMSKFTGVKRRQEVRGEAKGVMVIDDFAHHPTAVRETLKALKAKYSDRRLVAVFEPRSATSRRKVFQKDYGVAFKDADTIFIAAPYDQSKIQADDQFSSEQLVDDLKRSGLEAHVFATTPAVDDGVEMVAKLARPGDLVAVLSNGGFGGFIPKLLDRLKS